MSENYRSVGSYDGLRKAGGATDATIPGSAHYSSEVLTRKNMAGDWMFEHYQDYPNAQQLAQAASTKYDIGVAELIHTAGQFYDAKDATGFELNPNNSPFKREPQPAPQATPVSEVAERIRAKKGEQKDETPQERATRQQYQGEGLPVSPSRPLRPDEDALMSHEEVSHMLNAQIVRKGMEKEEGHLKAGKPKFAEEEHERTARSLKHGVTRAWEHTMGDNSIRSHSAQGRSEIVNYLKQAGIEAQVWKIPAGGFEISWEGGPTEEEVRKNAPNNKEFRTR